MRRAILAAVVILLGIAMGCFYPARKVIDRHIPEPKPPAEGRRTIHLDEGKRVAMEFVWIKPGKFLMGSPEGEKGREGNEKQHEVELTEGYWMQTTEVTQAQWEAVMGNNPSKFKGENHPVEQVSWDDFQEFLKKVNEKMSTMSGVEGQGALKADLPTEGEWENACRAGRPSGRASPELAEAGSTGRWCFGEEETKLGEYAWYDENSGGKTHPVGQKKPNAWGLYDMHGNVWEWCKDWYGECGGGVVDPRGPSTGTHRLVRGGSWYYFGGFSRCAYRGRDVPTNRGNGGGGRVVLRKSR